MGYDPQTQRFQELNSQEEVDKFKIEKPSGVIFNIGEDVELKGHKFYIHEIGTERIILKPRKN
jgi:uncharacterized Zn finger protein